MVAAATYLIGSLAPVVSGVRPLRWVSPFWYVTSSNPLANGLAMRDLAVLGGTALVLWVVAVLAFNRRDLRG
jgi:ABC-2 type transport system permease protein